jgi:hypothetical protein
MNLRRMIKLAFAVIVTVGLALAPMAAPVTSMHAQSDSMTEMSMPADMSCCPDEQKSKDCQDCPLVAICSLKNLQTSPWTAAALPLRHAIRTTHLVADDVLGDGLDRPPPDHPPRTLA